MKSSVRTAKLPFPVKGDKTRAKHLDPYKWKKGAASPNPAGRPKGSRGKLAEVFIRELLADWEVAGASAIQACRLEDPSTYLRVVASLVPKEFNIREGESTLETFLEQFDGQQLDELIAGLVALGTAQKGTGLQTKEISGTKSGGVH